MVFCRPHGSFPTGFELVIRYFPGPRYAEKLSLQSSLICIYLTFYCFIYCPDRGENLGGVWRGVTPPPPNHKYSRFRRTIEEFAGCQGDLSQRSIRLTSTAVMLSCLQICCFKHKILPSNTDTFEEHITAMPFCRRE